MDSWESSARRAINAQTQELSCLLNAVEAQQQVTRNKPMSVIHGLKEKLSMLEQVGRKLGVLVNMLTCIFFLLVDCGEPQLIG